LISEPFSIYGALEGSKDLAQNAITLILSEKASSVQPSQT